jgi:hypothetical protein
MADVAMSDFFHCKMFFFCGLYIVPRAARDAFSPRFIYFIAHPALILPFHGAI